MSSLGDLFHALPAVHALKAGLGAEVDWVVHDQYCDLAACFADVRRVIPYPRQTYLRDGKAFHDRLRQDAYDLAVDLQGLLKSALVARAARAERRIGPSFHREGSRLLYDEVAGPRHRRRHAVEENLDVVRHLGLPCPPPAFPLRVARADPGTPRPNVALAPRSRRADKNWPPERFAEVARDLRDRGAFIHVVGGKADVAAGAAIAEALGGRGVANHCGRTGLVELAGLLAAMDAMVTVDSGPMHMAAALGVPVVAVFGPTDPVRVGPYGPGHRVVRQSENLQELPTAPVLEAARAAVFGAAA